MELLSTACKDKYRLRKWPKAQVVTGLQRHLQKIWWIILLFKDKNAASYAIGFYTVARQLKSFI